MRKKRDINSIDLLFALSNILDLAAPELANHQQRVTLIASKIASQFDVMNKSRKENLFIAAILHDIGELTVEGKIRIVNREVPYKELKVHSKIGAHLFGLLTWLNPLKDIIKNHHKNWENFDASIDAPLVLESQIIHLADTIDSLIDVNKYILHQEDKIKAHIVKQKEISFHPSVVDAFIEASVHEEFWLDIENKDTYSLLKSEVTFEGSYCSVDVVLEISEFIRKLIDFKTHFTATHSAGVSESVACLSKLFNFTETQIKRMRTAGNLHDIGKLSIPNKILEKTEDLTNEEFAIIRRHTYFTYSGLSNVEGLLEIVEWGAYHHEKLDGSGYPFGLLDYQISFEARIIAVADIFTALIEDRPYRKGMKKEQVIKILSEQVNLNKLDKVVVKMLINNFDNCLKKVQLKQFSAKEQYEAIQKYKSL